MQKSNEMNKNVQKCLKLKLDDTIYKINDLEATSIEQITAQSVKKFGEVSLKKKLMYKSGQKSWEFLVQDSDLTLAWEFANIDKKGRSVLVIKLVDPKPTKISEKKNINFSNWKNLTSEERKELKQNTREKVKDIKDLETSSDSSVEKKIKNFRDIVREKIEKNPELKDQKHLLKKLWSESKDEFSQLIGIKKEKILNLSLSHEKNHDKVEWVQKKKEIFKTIMEKYPSFGFKKIGKIMKNHPKMGLEKLCHVLKTKETYLREKLKLDEKQNKYFDKFRKSYPRFPEFKLKKYILKNSDLKWDDLKVKVAEKREKYFKECSEK